MTNLLKMERYQMIHNQLYWCGVLLMFAVGLVTAESYVTEAVGPGGGAATSLCDILDGMVYDSTFLLIVISCILAFMLGQEFTGRTINQEVCAGHSRLSIFACKTIVYLIAFNFMAIVYPIAGCIREAARFGAINGTDLFLHFIRAVIYSFVMNSAIFFIPVLFCFAFQNMTKAVGATALTTFILSLYLGYGMMLRLPVHFLPTYQIRNVIMHPTVGILGEALLVAGIWLAILIFLTWKSFHKCDLK